LRELKVLQLDVIDGLAITFNGLCEDVESEAAALLLA